MRTTVVGRVDETARVRELARRAAAGHGAMILVEGEPGIGKSRLLAVAATEARRLGARVLRGAGIDGQATPFAVVRSWLDGAPPIDRGAADDELVVTELILDRLRASCAVGPVALLVDDLQWTDPSSLVLLGRLGRVLGRLPLLLAAAYQPAPRDPRLDALLRALHGHGAVPMKLTPLAEADVSRLVHSLLGAWPAPELCDLLAGAGGNPRYVTEVLGALARTGRIQVAAGVATLRHGAPRDAVPDALLDLIRRRLATLAPPVLETLRAAAVLGPGFDLTELAAALGRPVISLWQPVSEAVNGGLLADAGDHLVFRHGLIRQVLADDLPVAAADELRLRAGRALASAGARVERVARHLAAATTLAPDLVDWLARASGLLIARAPELATPLLERALAQRSDAASAVLRLQYARALLWAGRPAEARQAIQATPPVDGEYHWLLAQAYLQSGRIARARRVAEKVLTDIGDEAGRLHGLVAQCLLLSGRIDAADSAAGRAQTGTDGYGSAYALSIRAGVRLVRQRPQEALDLADRVLAVLDDEQIRPDRPFAPHLVRGLCLLELDRFAEAESAFDTGREDGGPTFLAWHHLGGAHLRYLDGRWDDALAQIRAGLDGPDPLRVAPSLRSQAALIALHRGSNPDALDHRDPNPYWGWLALSVRALDRERAGDLERALLSLRDGWDRGWTGCCLAAELARLAGATGLRSHLRPVVDTLDRAAVHHPAPHVRATAALCRGVVEADPVLLRTAAQGFAAAGRPLYEGYAYEAAAGFLAAAGSKTAARTALDAAVGCYDRLGAAWDLDRAQARLRGAGVRCRHVRHRPKTGWEALTQTERRVVALVAAGRSNPDIAAELYLSRRTVRNHVSHILAKLGLRSRVELAVSAYENSFG